MKSLIQRFSAAASAFSLALLLGLPVPQLLVAAHASSHPNVTWSATDPIVYFPIRGDVVNTGLNARDPFVGAPSEAGVTAPGFSRTSSSTVPGAPTIASVTAGSGSVSVVWTPPTSNGGASIRSYVVEYSVVGSSSWTVASSSVTRTSYSVTGLSSALSYIFEVAATNRSGTGPWSLPSISVTPLVAAVPGAPTNTTATAGTGSATVSWTAPTNTGGSSIRSYVVEYSVVGSSSWTVASSSVPHTSYSVTGLSSASSYIFEVAATNGSGTGTWSLPSNQVKPLASSNGIIYHGGPVLVNSVNVYPIWYGNWTTSSTPARQALVQTFLEGIGGTKYFNTNSSYYNASGTFVQNVVNVVKSATVTTGSTSLNQNSFATIVANVIGSGGLPADSNGVYFVFTSQDVAVSGFLTQYCGFHSAMTVNSTPIQFSFVGDPSGSSLAACAIQTNSSPNNDPAGDAMVSVIAHELSEATTDPQLNAWYSATGYENGDLCAWNFGTTFAATNGSFANVKWTVNNVAYQFLIQQMWVNAAGGYCTLSY